MQYGRLMGAGLAALGALLIFLELSFFLNSRRADADGDFARFDRLERRSHHVPALPGILGGVLLIAGSAVFLMARMEDEPDPKNAVR